MGGPSQQQGGREESPNSGGFVDAVRELSRFTTNASRDASVRELLEELEKEYLGQTNTDMALFDRYDQLQRSLGVGTPSSAFRPATNSPVRENVHQEHAPTPQVSPTRLEAPSRPFPSREELTNADSRSVMIEQIQELSQRFDDLSNLVFKLHSDAGGDLSRPSSSATAPTRVGQERSSGFDSREGAGTRLIEDEKLRALLLDVKKLKERNAELVQMLKEYRLGEEKYKEEITHLQQALKKEREDHLKLQRSHEKLVEKATQIHDYYTELSSAFKKLDEKLKVTLAEKAELLKIAAAYQRNGASRYAPQATQPGPGKMLAGIDSEELTRSGTAIASVYVGHQVVDHLLPNNNVYEPVGAGFALAICVYWLLGRKKQR